jgi:hypothetical protein
VNGYVADVVSVHSECTTRREEEPDLGSFGYGEREREREREREPKKRGEFFLEACIRNSR